MCSADSVRAERTKVVENKCCGLSEIFLSNRDSFLWPLDLIRFCVEAYKAKPFRRAVVPSRDLHVSVVGCVSPPPSSGSGGRENEKRSSDNEKLRSLRALKQMLKGIGRCGLQVLASTRAEWAGFMILYNPLCSL